MIEMILCLAIAAGAFIASYFQFREKGILLNNAWLYASKEEREALNKKPYYRQSGVVFALIGITFLLNAVMVAVKQKEIFYIVLGMLVVTVIYAIVSTIRIEKGR